MHTHITIYHVLTHLYICIYAIYIHIHTQFSIEADSFRHAYRHTHTHQYGCPRFGPGRRLPPARDLFGFNRRQVDHRVSATVFNTFRLEIIAVAATGATGG